MAARVGLGKTCLALDLDNTLWGGIVGEDGPGGIAIGPSGLGAAFAAFQDALLALRAQGVLLAVASKNNDADAFEVFDHHPGMRIRREHLAAHRISWQSKSESLRELAGELSLGVDSFAASSISWYCARANDSLDASTTASPPGATDSVTCLTSDGFWLPTLSSCSPSGTNRWLICSRPTGCSTQPT